MAAMRRQAQKIRAPRRGIDQESIDFGITWKNLEVAFKEILTKNASKLSYEELYRHAYRIVLKKKGQELYIAVTTFIREWLEQNVCGKIRKLLVPSLLTTLADGPTGASVNERRTAGDRFLHGLKDAWADHQVCMAMMADVLMYLDRVYGADMRNPSVYHTCMDLFRDHVLLADSGSQESSLKSVLLILNAIVLEQIQMERSGDVINKAEIKNCINMLEALYQSGSETEDQRLYITSFEPDFLEASKMFYQHEGEQLMREGNAETYSEKVTKRIKEEQERCRSTLSESTTHKIEEVVELELIANRIRDVIEMESGVRFMIDNERLVPLGLLYDLSARVDPKKVELTKAVQKRIIDLGNEVNKAVIEASQPPPPGAPAVPNQQTAAALKWVEDILSLKDKFDAIWLESFRLDQAMQTSLTRSFADFINSSTFSRGSEYISLFIDDNMKKGIKDKTEEEVDQVLDKAITLLRYVQDKDLFELYYKKHLSKRLLMNKSISIDVEKQMISRMKIELGNNFTSKLEAMFKDIAVSKELSTGFKEYVASRGDPDLSRVDLKIDVLTSGTWPLSQDSSEEENATRPKVIYPPQVARVKQDFQNFYQTKHTGRELTWHPDKGTADLIIRFKNGQGSKSIKEVNMPTYSMIILLLFQDLPEDKSLSFADIQAMTNIPPADLKRQLQSLAVASKTRILKKVPMSREVVESDEFFFNEGFRSDYRRLKVGVIAANNRAETERERRDTEKKNDASRIHLIEAAIVRIMKQRQTLKHEQLLVETVQQLAARFKPDVPMIKSRIENLIEREYLERVEGSSPAAYKYLA
ncbi:Cullin-domain-containing protein [Tothia fuscella]|uniref:Cullin-domain-containing protein n=1 Tax=Tothia fuscella TaxID=1048955 RepID=A0A9P4NDX8_9PEZI|nr:Cullin-domain-containing protein [Tothia fuscella]